MDLVVDDNGGINVNSVVGAKRAKPCVNTSLSPAFDSHLKAKKCSSNESIYEIVGESINGDSDNEIHNRDCEADLHKNMNGKVDVLETSGNRNQNNSSQDPSDSAEMDEEFVIVDDENEASDENNDCNEKASDAKVNLLDCDNMDEILKDFAVEGGKSVPRLSDNGDEIESAVVKNDVTQTKDEKKLDARVILSSDDEDEIGGLLDEFREVDSSDENSNLEKTDSVSATANEKPETSAGNDCTVLKSLSTGEKSGDVNNKITSSHSNLQSIRKKNSSAENSVSRTNSAMKNDSVCEIETVLVDEKSNDSIVIIDDDDDDNIVKEKSQNKHSNEISQTTLPKPSSPLNSPASFSSSSEDKFEFDSMILDIVNDGSPEKGSKSDNSHSKSTEFLLSDPSRSLLKPLMSDTNSVENKSNTGSLHKSANIDLTELTSKQFQSEEKPSSDSTSPSTNFLGETENTQSSLNKLTSDNERRSDTSDQFFNCNGNVSTSSDLSSNTRKDKGSDSEAQDDSNCSTTIKLAAIDELITSKDPSVSSKHASCDENKDSVDTQISIVDFPTELLVGETSQAAESLEVKNDKSSNVTNFEQLKLGNKNNIDDKTKSEVKSDPESKKSNDDINMEVEEKTNCKYVTDEKKPQVKMDDDDDGKAGIKEEEKKIGSKIELLNVFESEQSDGKFDSTLNSPGKKKDSSHNCNTKRKPYSNFWFREVRVRKSGKTKGKTDVYYYPPKPNKRLRSLKEVKRYCKKEKIPYPEQYDFCTNANIKKRKKARLKKIKKVISLSPMCKTMKKLEENICGDRAITAVFEKLEINRSQVDSGSPKIGDEVKADPEFKVDSCPKSDNSAENKITNLVELEKVQAQNVLNKRKLEDGDDEEVKMKKPKCDDEDIKDTTLLNGDTSSTSSSDFKLINTKLKDEVADEVQNKVLDTVESLLMMLGKPNKKIQVTKNSMDHLALCFSIQPWKENYKEALSTMKLLEDKLQLLNEVAEKYRTKIAESRDFQRNKFTQYNFRPKVPTRTVGVNVKIYRESEIKSAMLQNATKTKVEGKICVTPLHKTQITTNMKKENTIVPKTQPARTYETKNINPLPDNKSLVTNLQMKDTIISPVVPTQQVARKPLLPRIITQAAVNKIVTLPGSRAPPPNVTMAGNKFISVGRPPSSNVVFVPSSSITSPSANQQLQKVVAAGITTTASGTTMGKVNMPGMPGNPNVLVPLKDYLQLLPAGAKGTVIQQSSRPSLIPPLPSSLVGARTVTYIVPQNSALANARGIQPFIPSQNQQVQFVLRVTNPGNVPGLNSVVNTVARPTIMQPPLATAAPRLQPPMATTPQPQTVAQPPVAQTPRNSGLILISHTSKPQKSNEKISDKMVLQTYYPGQEDSTPSNSASTHPAPFPKSQHYPDNKGKAIPPKPALKGSKNQSGGIVLSWNMSLGNKNANIASYQLFAYQETDGPVDASLWKKVGDVNALPLPMACTLTQFVDKNRYYFTVRAVDVFQRFGPFSDPVSILFEKDGENVKKEK